MYDQLRTLRESPRTVILLVLGEMRVVEVGVHRFGCYQNKSCAVGTTSQCRIKLHGRKPKCVHRRGETLTQRILTLSRPTFLQPINILVDFLAFAGRGFRETTSYLSSLRAACGWRLRTGFEKRLRVSPALECECTVRQKIVQSVVSMARRKQSFCFHVHIQNSSWLSLSGLFLCIAKLSHTESLAQARWEALVCATCGTTRFMFA